MLEVLQTNLQSATGGDPGQKKVRIEDRLGYRPDVYRLREVHGSWQRPYDFTFTLAGFVLGFYNLWRFPYLVYRFGTIFYIPFIFLLITIGVPILYMEFTIGQYLSIGPTYSFGSMAPILTGISYLVAWNSLISSWLYMMLFSWTRMYGSVATSCGRGWEKCEQSSYYNTIDCYNGQQDLECDESFSTSTDKNKEKNPETSKSKNLEGNHTGRVKIYWNFTCTDLEVFCQYHDWVAPTGNESIGEKVCMTKKNEPIDINTRRNHSAYEYFLGAVCGMTRRKNVPSYQNKGNKSKEDMYEKAGSELVIDHTSTSGDQMLLIDITSWIMFIIFLRDDMLSISVIAYLLNFAPYVCLVFFSIKAVTFEFAVEGLQEIFTTRGLSSINFGNFEMWVEAGVQVICTTGIGVGALINLASLNRFRHRYILDIVLVCVFNIATSSCALVICFCTIGHYISFYGISTPFHNFIKFDSSHSSVEFGFTVYSLFLFFIKENLFLIFLFFFMITSLSTDSVLRLVHETLSATMEIVPALRNYRFTTLLIISVYGCAAIYPMCKNGGLATFIEYEYLTIEFVTPIVLFIETILVGWVYKGERIYDNSEEMGVNNDYKVRLFVTWSLRIVTPFTLLIMILYRMYMHWVKKSYKFSGIKREAIGVLFGYIFVFGPLILFLLAIMDILINNRKRPWRWFIYPAQEQQRIYIHQLKAHHSIANEGLVIDHGGPGDEKEDEKYAEYIEAFRDAGLDEVDDDDESKSNMKQLKEWFINIIAAFDKWPGRFNDHDSSDEESIPTSDESDTERK